MKIVKFAFLFLMISYLAPAPAAWAGTQYFYDSQNMVSAILFPDCGVVVYEKDAAGSPIASERTQTTLESVEIAGPTEIYENSSARYEIIGHYTNGMDLRASGKGLWGG